MKTDFKVYKRKIHVYRQVNALDQLNEVDHIKADGKHWTYAWSTNAYKTCRDAAAAAINGTNAQTMFKAWFAK